MSMSELIDLREHFGIWDRCGNTRFFRKTTRSSMIYLNPLDGLLVSAHGTPSREGEVRYTLVVRDASKAEDGDIEKAYQANYPWVERAVKTFFYYTALGWALDAIREHTGKDPLPGDKDMGNFLALYEPGGKRYREEGGSPESDKPMLEETLQAITTTIAGMPSTTVDYGRNLSKDDIEEALAGYGIIEC